MNAPGRHGFALALTGACIAICIGAWAILAINKGASVTLGHGIETAGRQTAISQPAPLSRASAGEDRRIRLDGSAAPPVPAHMTVPSHENGVFRGAVTVTHDNGVPASGARVMVDDGHAFLDCGRTDGQGNITFVSQGPTVTMILLGACPYPYRVAIDVTKGPASCILPTGLTIAGSTTVDGLPPASPIALRITDGHPLDARHELPAPYRARLSAFLSGQEQQVSSQLTNSEGRFLFSGIAPGWTGSLRVPVEYVLENGVRRVPVSSDTPSVLLRLRRSASISGTVVRGTIPARAHGTYTVWCESQVYDGVCDTDEVGRFSIALQCQPWTDFSCWFRSQDGMAVGSLQLRAERESENREVGDVLLQEVHQATVCVVAEDGSTLGRALVWLSGGDPDPGVAIPSGERCASIRVSPYAKYVHVLALGYQFASFEVRQQPGYEHRVSLRRGTLLRVHLVGDEAFDAGAVEVQISGPGPLFLDDLMRNEPDRMAALGGSIPRGWASSTNAKGVYEATELTFSVGSARTITLSGITPGSVVRIEAKDGQGRILGSVEDYRIESGSWSDVDVSIH